MAFRFEPADVHVPTPKGLPNKPNCSSLHHFQTQETVAKSRNYRSGPAQSPANTAILSQNLKIPFHCRNTLHRKVSHIFISRLIGIGPSIADLEDWRHRQVIADDEDNLVPIGSTGVVV